MKNKIIIGSRGSKLAVKYAQDAKDKILENSNFKSDDILIKEISTQEINFKTKCCQMLEERDYFHQI